MTLLVRNEADIVQANLDYHLAQGVDHVIVTDHGSSDETPEMLRAYEERGTVTALRDEGEEHHQSMRVTRMARIALTQQRADWVIHNDADEFWWPLVGTLRDVFAAIPREYGQIEVQRRNFLPRPDRPEPFYSRLIYREPQSLNGIGRPLEPKVAHRPHPDVVVAPGNHWISGPDLRPAPAAELLEIFHYPMRSYEQFERKVVQVGIGYEKLEYRSPEVGRDQLKLLQVCRDDGLRKYYAGAIIEDTAIEQGIKDGSIVLDRRLETFMQGRSELAATRRRPDGPASRALIARTLRAALDADAAKRASEHAQAQLAVAEAQLAEARAENGALTRRLAATRTWRGSLVNLLGVMGGSSLVRRSPRLLRLWQRLSGSVAGRR
jgi:hypothetical protein